MTAAARDSPRSAAVYCLKKDLSLDATISMPTVDRHPLEDCRPLGDRVVVRVQRPRGVTSGGIHLPDSAQRDERPQIGVVHAAGPKVSGDLARGVRVFFAPFTANRVDVPGYEGDDYIVLREEDVLGVFPDDSAS